MTTGHNGADWRQERELMQMRESLASALKSVENMLEAQGMPPEKRLILSRSERRRVVQPRVSDNVDKSGEREAQTGNLT